MFSKTKAVINNLIREINLSLFIVEILSEVLFCAFYLFLAFTHWNTLVAAIIYITLAAIALGWGIFYSSTYYYSKKQKAARRKVKEGLKYISWVLRALVIGYNIYLVLTTTVSDLDKMLIIISIILLAAQIIFEIIAKFVIRHYRLIECSLEIEYQDNQVFQSFASMLGLDRVLDKEVDNEISKKVNAIELKEYGESKVTPLMEIDHKLHFSSYKINKNKFLNLLLKYHNEAASYLRNETELTKLVKDVNENIAHLPNEKQNHLIAKVFSFFILNYLKPICVGLEESVIIDFISSFLFFYEESDFENPTDISYMCAFVFELYFKKNVNQLLSDDIWSMSLIPEEESEDKKSFFDKKKSKSNNNHNKEFKDVKNLINTINNYYYPKSSSDKFKNGMNDIGKRLFGMAAKYLLTSKK